MPIRSVLACLLALLIAGCSAPPAAAPRPAQGGWRKPWQSDKPMPAWIADPTASGTKVAAYGSAEYRGSESHAEQRDRAMQSARDELARTIRVRIQSAIKDYLSESQAGITTFNQEVSQQIADQSVAGSYQAAEWSNEKTDELFVWAVMEPGFTRHLASAVAAQTDAAGDPALSAHLKAKAGADAGFAELDQLLQKQFKTP